MNRETLANLAKAELHCHLDGSISLGMLRHLAELSGTLVPETDEELKRLVMAPAETESLVDYLKTFDFVRPLLQTEEALSLAAYDVARQAAEENVIYIEIRFAPELSMDQGLSAAETVLAVLDGLKKAETDFGIVARALVCGMRQSSPELIRDLFAQIAELSTAGLAGFDFAGDEHGFPPSEIADLIRYTQGLGRPMTLHAGECGCAHHIAESMTLGLKRLGHVTAIHDQPEILADFVKKGVTAELCLSSNLHTKAAASLETFPYWDLKKAGAKITINTDNRTVSNTSLTEEYSLFVQYFETSLTDFLSFNQNALAAAFISEAERRVLMTRLEKAYEKEISRSVH